MLVQQLNNSDRLENYKLKKKAFESLIELPSYMNHTWKIVLNKWVQYSD